MKISHFFDKNTSTLTYLVIDEKTKDAIIIDPVLDFDYASGSISSTQTDILMKDIQDNHLNILAILETHAHADHLSSSQLLKQAFPQAKLAIGEKIKIVQEVFKGHFNLSHLKIDGSQFDHLFKDFEEVQFGSIKIKAIPTAGHTPACMSYLIEDAVFTGDALFMPDYGTGRCDFPKGSSEDLFMSISENLYSLNDETRVFVGHDYLPNNRELKFQTTIGESKKHNIQLKDTTKKDEYIEFRTSRDKTLNAPQLLLPSVQFNIDGGYLPPKEENQKNYFKIPLNIKLSREALARLNR